MKFFIFLPVKRFFFIVSAVILLCSCRNTNKPSGSGDDSSSLVVATNSWTAAYAWAAGAENVVTLAPFEMPHPSEYELRPGDIPKLRNAKLVIYAGYEIMTEQLKKGLDLPPEKLLLIDTDYSYVSIEESIMKIAAKLGTESAARVNLQAIRHILDEARKTLEEKGMSGMSAIVHHFQVSIAQELGLTTVMVFGPASPEASEIVTVSKTDASIIIDNYHNPVGQPFKEVLPNATYIQLLNFPGYNETKTLTEVIRHNINLLIN